MTQKAKNMNLKTAAQQALEALYLIRDGATGLYGDDLTRCNRALETLITALSGAQDWDELEALRAYLREHMVEIHRLRAAGRQALEALEQCGLNDERRSYECEHAARVALRTALAEDVPETNFGNMEQVVDSSKTDHIAGVSNMVATSQEFRQVEPVAWRVHPFDYGVGIEGAYAMTMRPDQVEAWKRKGWNIESLYTAPPKREPLTEEEISAIDWKSGETLHDFARAIERAHGIGGWK